MAVPSALHIAQTLIRKASPTPDDAGCQEYIESLLHPYGFVRTSINCNGIINSVYERPGEIAGILAFAGHTDVVPTGPLQQWQYPPFDARLVDGVLHGRGAQDMKGGIACWLEAVVMLCEQKVQLPCLQLLITSDEEGESIDGTVRIVEYLQQQQRLPDAAIVGEPSSAKKVGDTIRRGRRGVVQARITFQGKQGHSAYPQDADNAIHHAAPALAKIVAIDWGSPTDGFPPTSCQITNITGGEGVSNVIPGSCEAQLDIRYNPGNDFETICSAIKQACAEQACTFDFDHVANAFSTADGLFLEQVCNAIYQTTDIMTHKDTGGGTSDARFLAAAGVPVAELGLTNDTIHQLNERVAIHELVMLTTIYTHIISHFEA